MGDKFNLSANSIYCMEDVRHALKPGMVVRVHQKIKDIGKNGEEKVRIQIFEGTILAVKHGNETGATFTVRKVSNGVGVEKIFPIHSPIVDMVELVRQYRVRQGRAYYLRNFKKRLKEVPLGKMSSTSEEKTKAPDEEPTKIEE